MEWFVVLHSGAVLKKTLVRAVHHAFNWPVQLPSQLRLLSDDAGEGDYMDGTAVQLSRPYNSV
jgi:hypothetical protein